MIKKLCTILVLFLVTGVSVAGSYEDALKKNNKVFLYFYAPDCRTCSYFDNIYENIKKQNKEYAYVKVNVNTSYGNHLILKFRGRYVPYIILTDSNAKKSVNINHTCVMDEVCLIRAMKSFKG